MPQQPFPLGPLGPHTLRQLLSEKDKVAVLVHDTRNAVAGALNGTGWSGRLALPIIKLPAQFFILLPGDQGAAIGPTQGQHAGAMSRPSRRLDLARRQELALAVQPSEVNFVLEIGRAHV